MTVYMAVDIKLGRGGVAFCVDACHCAIPCDLLEQFSCFFQFPTVQKPADISSNSGLVLQNSTRPVVTVSECLL